MIDTQTHNAPTPKVQSLARGFFHIVAWRGNGVQLHRPVTQRVVYTKTILHRADFTHLNSKLCADQLCKKTSFYNDMFLHRFPLFPFDTGQLLHERPFAQSSFCTEQFLHKDSLTQNRGRWLFRASWRFEMVNCHWPALSKATEVWCQYGCWWYTH